MKQMPKELIKKTNSCIYNNLNLLYLIFPYLELKDISLGYSLTRWTFFYMVYQAV